MTKRRGKNLGKGLLAGFLVLLGLGVIALGTEGRLQLPTNEKPTCSRTASFGVDWTNRQNLRARTIEWGVTGSTTVERNVQAAFQKVNIFMPCGADVRIVAEFAQTPKNLNCQIITGGKTFKPSVPSAKLGRRCVVEATIPA